MGCLPTHLPQAYGRHRRADGISQTAGLVPNLLFSLHAGAWVDRHGRRRQTMLMADVGRAVLLATIPIAYAFDALTFAQLYVVGFLTGILSVLFWVSYNTLFVSLVSRDRYVEANSLLNGSRALSFVGGPSVAGILVQLLTAPVTLILDAMSFLASAFSIISALVPGRLRSRVSGAYMVVNYGVRPLGSLVAGALGSWIGLRPTLWIATVGAIAGFLFLLPSPMPGLRELPEPDA